MSWAVYVAGLFKQYPELGAIILGACFSWAPALILETWFLPETWPDRKMKQVTLSITATVATLVSATLWHVLDPTDKSWVVILISASTALSAPAIHVLAAKVLTHFFPYLDSVFKFKAKGNG